MRAKTQTLQFAVSGASGTQAQLEISNQNGLQLFETEPNNGLNSGQIQLTAGRTYILRMRAKENVATPYQLDLTLI